MTRVYRIETTTGRGICAATGSPLCDLYLDACGDETEHCVFRSCQMRPDIREIAKRTPTLAYAFPSLKALRTWFPQARGRALMAQHGALGVEYEVPELLAESPFQCVFDKAKATKVSEFDLSKEN